MGKNLRPNQRRRNKYFVNVYLIDKAYGGGEEGGWWYKYGVCIESWRHRSAKQADRTVAWAKAQSRYQGTKRSLDSVIHHLGDTVRIEIESHEGADWSDYRRWE